MSHVAHSDWTFEHSVVHHPDPHLDPHSLTTVDTSHTTQTTQTDSVASVLKTLWHQGDLMNGTAGSAAHSGSSTATNAAITALAPKLTVGSNALNVNAGGSTALPITVAAGAGHGTSVTISGLTHYESVTDHLDHKVFTGSSVTLTAAEVNSGLSLASNYTGTGHPVNTLSVTASDVIDGHTLASGAQNIVVTDPPVSTTTTGSSSSGLSLQVSGDMYNGDPQIQVFVDGHQVGGTYDITAHHSAGQTQTIQIAGNFDPTVAHQVQVKFVNDAWDGTSSADGHDRNVYISSISMNGTTIDGAQGTDLASNGAVHDTNATEAVMDMNGAVNFNVAAESSSTSTGTTAGTGSNGLALQVSGDMYNGDPQIQVFVDGHQVGGTYDITAHHSEGQTQTIQIAGNFDPTVAHQVQIKFVNDAWDGTSSTDGHDRNVYVSSISMNGTTIDGAQGANTADNGSVHDSNAHDAVMDTNGTLTFQVAADAPAGGSGSTGTGTGTGTGAGTGTGTGTGAGTGTASGSGLTLQVSGDMYNGDPQIQVFVDGQQVGGTYDITAHHSEGQTQTIQIAGDFPPSEAHQVQVKFINDAWDGTSNADGHDMNVYVSSISMNGLTFTGAQGTNTANNGAIHDSNANEAVMDVDGTLTFNVPDPPVGGGSTGSGTGTGTGTGTVGMGAGSPPTGTGFYVAANGSDSNPGTLAAPFATLAHAQQAMEHSTTKTTYVEAGTYHLSSTLNLNSADSGETWAYYPANGVDTAILDGGNSTGQAINIQGGSNITINGLSVEHFTTFGIEAQGGATNVTIENCDVGYLTSTATPSDALSLSNAPNSTISHNYVHDISSFGIAVYAYYSGQSANGDVVTGNVLVNCTTKEADCGAIYTDMDQSGTSGGHVTISNNLVEGWGGSTGNQHAVYLDDNSSNVTVTGNVLALPQSVTGSNYNGTSVFFAHDGSHNTFSDNIIDLGNSGHVVAGNWGQDGNSMSGMGSSTFTNNIIISSNSGSQQTAGGSTSGSYSYVENNNTASDFTIQNNLYYDYAGGQVSSTGNLASDSHAVTGTNPMLSGVTYQLASNSPAYSLVGFTPIVGGWGPQGFVVPTTGAQPSSAV